MSCCVKFGNVGPKTVTADNVGSTTVTGNGTRYMVMVTGQNHNFNRNGRFVMVGLGNVMVTRTFQYQNFYCNLILIECGNA